jgi:hypothetical protein
MTRSQKIAIFSGVATSFLLIGLAALFLWVWAIRPELKQATRTPIRFDLANRIEIPNHPSLQFRRGPFSISMWFRTTSKRSYIAFIGKRINCLGDGWVLGANEKDGLSFYTAGCASPASRPQNFRDGQWHHLVAMRTGQTMTFYYDNQNVGSGPDTCDHNELHPLRLGMDADGGWHFEGEMAEVHLYNRALTESEVALEWNEGKGRATGLPIGGLLAGYHFEDLRGNQAIDFSGNGHHGVLARSSVPAAEQN